MRKISVKIGVTAAFALALVGFSISQPYALTINCDAGQAQGQGQGQGQGQTIQAAVDAAGDGDIIEVSGTCTEIVTITTDGITVRGGSGTLNGGFIVDGAQRVVIDNLTIDGSTSTGPVNGVLARNNAHVTVRNCTIENHARSGVNIRSTSSGLVEGNTIGNNTDYGVLVDLGTVIGIVSPPRPSDTPFMFYE